ncbi:flagellar basal body rod protein FlgC [Fodinisporobacter ferrooxydans]|uniref:Flagellar basal-body rod protein FlgC n=1 Tax=Fodinisporobacter ferrooxydans TaxID=2901836 RepID=A0ABY4CFQ0_9BACL|nr:flagellar basal body rod protein FlgC [Alicyclobacillaceae bacterium MYW30-H2]
MSLFQGIDISASGLTAQRLRMDVIANNIANANTTRTPGGTGPYRREVVELSQKPASAFGAMLNQSLNPTGDGVQVTKIAQDQSPFKLVYDPGNPDAVKDPKSPMYGYVRMPNVNIVTEMVDLISASRSYEADITALNASKSIDMKALQIGK